MKKKIIAILITLQLLFTSFSAYAAEITAIDFLGEVIGKVLPDGKVINLNNNVIGLINADSQIVNAENDIIGGIVPQGIAIGNDFKVLGRPTENGKILSPNGSITGNVLPNGLVVDDGFEIIGSVLFPGIVFSDAGQYVGRLNGEGLYTDISGKQIGFITPDGYAYKKVADQYVLDGRLISSKMVLSLDGKPIGSLNPEGSLLNFNAEEIGQVRANGFIYNNQDKIVGKTIRSGYAFDNKGAPIGFITYNGRVVNKTDETGRVFYNEIIVNDESKPIGFSLPTTATATDLKGVFLGVVSPSGAVVKGSEKVGFVTAKGVVLDVSDNIIGKVIKTGPVYNYKSDVVAHALPDGRTYSLSGAANGYIKGKNAYDLNGKIFGIIYDNSLIFSNDNDFLGLSGITNKISVNNQDLITSNYGYAYTSNGDIEGQSLGLDFVYNQQGSLIGLSNPLGYSQTLTGQKLGDILGSGFVVDALNKTIGKTFNPQFLNDNAATQNLLVSGDNIIYNKGGNIEAKVLPDTSVVATKLANTVELMPQISKAYEDIMVVSYDGQLLGYVDYDNYLRDFKNAKIGSITNNKVAINNSGSPIGEVVSLGSAFDKDCNFIGVANLKSEVRNFRDVMLGKVLANSFILSQNSITGYIAKTGSVVDFNGTIIGYTSNNAQVYNSSKEKLGCINHQKTLKTKGNLLGRVVEYANAINFDNIIVGRTLLDASVVDANSRVIGYLQPNATISSITGDALGILFEYKYAFDGNNKFMGLVNDKAEVIGQNSQVVAKVLYDGSVVSSSNNIVGFALNDLYVYDNDGIPVGYIEPSGNVKDFENNSLGLIKKGFLVDNKDNVIARASRDYVIRDNNKIAIGYLDLDGKVINEKAENIGSINKSGEIKDSSGKVIAIARPLQYHNNINITPKRDVVVNADGQVIGYVDEYGNVYDSSNNKIGNKTADGRVVDEDGKEIGRVLSKKDVYDEEGNIIGTTKSDGTVVDENGKVIGKLNENGELINANGNVIGGINKDWYEKVEDITTARKDNRPVKENVVKEYLRSISIALTPDGEYFGEVLSDGSVIDANGNKVGTVDGNGLVVDLEGNYSGITEAVKKDKASKEAFIPPGAFGKGNPYGTGTGLGGASGAGGGYGPGERYYPPRVQALKLEQNSVRQAASVGAPIVSSFNPSSFNYTQDNWEGIESSVSTWKVDMSEMILADKPIPAVIARPVYSTSTEVPVTAYVERNVYSEEGRNIIIPAGSRIIGQVGGFSSGSEQTSNAAKVSISWSRIIRPDGAMFDIDNSVTGDAQGRQGALGYLDRELAKKYISPLLVTAVKVGGSYLLSSDEEGDGETESSGQQAANEAREEFLTSMNQIFSNVLQDSLDSQPLVFIPAGTRIIVYPKKDLWLKNPDKEKSQAAIDTTKKDRLISEKPTGASNVSNNQQQGGADQVVYGTQNNTQAKTGGSAPLIGGAAKPAQNPAVVVPPPAPPPSQGGSTTSTNNNEKSESSFGLMY